MKKVNIIFGLLLCMTSAVMAGCNKNYKPPLVIIPGDGNRESDKDTSMRYLENDRVKLGIDLSIGGAVTFLTDVKNGGRNMINSADWGRQIQLSYYSGPIPYIGPNGEKPYESWAGLGWNPIQSGDVGGNRSKVIEFEYRDKQTMYVRCIPMQWPHATGVAGDCEFECIYTLKDNVFTIEATINNRRSDKTKYGARDQEMPALYTNGPWYKLVSYLGDQPFQDQPVTVLVDRNDGKGWPWTGFYTPEQWVALLDDAGMGIGVFQPEATVFLGGFHGGDALKGSGEEKDSQTGYIAPITQQILDHDIRWTYKTSFILGNIDDIRQYAKENRQIKARPEWQFRQSRQGWYWQGEADDAGWQLSGTWDIQFKKTARLVSPTTFWKAEDVSSLEMEGAFETDSREIAIGIEIRLFDNAVCRLTKTVQADGKNRTYRFNLSEITEYKGAVRNIFVIFPDNDGTAKIKQIRGIN
ncbi:MAG: hypothetical protein LBR08_07155 [Bacteroidales bacterium]|jgi:hypothetical protein|nr:hypothetical protein [Bacteroidales bacterium]